MKDIVKIYTSHTLNNFALSVISVYVPIYLLNLGYSLEKVIFYYIAAHLFGLFIGFFICVRLMDKIGVIKTFKLYYPVQIIYLISLFLLAKYSFSPMIVALFYGAATYMYWMPINQLFINHSPKEEMGKNMSKFFAYPQLFKIFGPLIGVVLIPIIGFWPVFVLTTMGIMVSFVPLMSVNDKIIKVSINLTRGWDRIKNNKSLFVFEIFDNIIEESQWFWPIYVYLIIGNLTTPGIVGSLEALGASIFTLFIGKISGKYSKKLIPLSSVILVLIFLLRIFIDEPLSAYIITIVAAFIVTMFLITYFSTIFKTVKGVWEEEFIVIREIPTVIGRMIVFGGILLFINHLNYFFIIPALATAMLVIFYYRKKHLLAD